MLLDVCHHACRQLQAGARVLDIRLAINPWLAVQARAQQATSAKSSTSSAVSVPTSHAAANRRLSRNSSWRALLQQQEPPIVSRRVPDAASTGFFQKLSALIAAAASTMSSAMFRVAASAAAYHRNGPAALNGPILRLDPVLLEGAVDMQSAGGPLTAAERQGCIVTSHSLPAAPLSTVLGDVRRFLAENPGEVGDWPFTSSGSRDDMVLVCSCLKQWHVLAPAVCPTDNLVLLQQ